MLLLPSENAFHACGKFGDVERLGEIVVGTEVEARHFVLKRVFCLNDDDTSFFAGILEMAQHVEPVAIG